jgi:transcriptional regulator with XRE-family HTH domain
VQVYSQGEEKRPRRQGIGGNVYARRLRRGLTLQDLAERSGVSRAMISEIERGSKNPTVRVALQLAAGLGCTVSELLGERPHEEEGTRVLRRDQRRVLLDPGSGVERHLLSDAFDRRGITVARYLIPARQKTGAFPSQPPGTWAHVTVLRGTVDCCLDGTGPDLHLEAGDAVEFSAEVAFGFENPGRRPCELLLIVDAGAGPPLPYVG